MLHDLQNITYLFTEGFPTLRKWAPIWIPATLAFSISTLVVNSSSIRGKIEAYFPSYVQLLRENYGFSDEDKEEREFYFAACEYQSRPQNILVHSVERGVEKIRVDGSTSTGDIQIKASATSQHDIIHPDMLEVEDEDIEEYGSNIDSEIVGKSTPSVDCIDNEISKRERSVQNKFDGYNGDENVEEMDSILQSSVWDASSNSPKDYIDVKGKQVVSGDGKEKEETENLDDTKDYYIPSQDYNGKKDGYIFTTREQGVGYYVDKKPKNNSTSWNITKTAVVTKMRHSSVDFFMDGLNVMKDQGGKLNGQEIMERRKLEKLQHKLDYHIQEKNIGLRILDDCERDIKSTKDEMKIIKRKLSWSLW